MMSRAQAYYLASRLLPYVPPSLGYRVCDRLSYLAPFIPGRDRILANLEHVLPDASPATRRRYARDVIAGLLKNYYDLLRSHALSPAELACSVDVQGLENLLGAIARGKGVIAAMPHMGNFSLVAEPVATLIRTPLLVVVEQMKDAATHSLLNTLRKRRNIEVVEVGPQVVRRIVRMLRAGSLVVLLSDRTVTDATVEVTFFDAPAPIPSGAATLALHTGAALLTAYTYRQSDNRSMLIINPPLLLERRGTLAFDVRRTMQAIIRIFEAYIRRHPGQWLLTEPVWTTA